MLKRSHSLNLTFSSASPDRPLVERFLVHEFELFGIKYTGTDYLGSALAMDKGLAKQLFIYNNVPTPKGFEIEKNDGLDYLKMLKDNNIDYPVVVKPCCGGSSVGVSLPNNDEEYKIL